MIYRIIYNIILMKSPNNNFSNKSNNSLNTETNVQHKWNRLQNMIPTLSPLILKKIGNRLSHVKNTSQFANLMCY